MISQHATLVQGNGLPADKIDYLSGPKPNEATQHAFSRWADSALLVRVSHLAEYLCVGRVWEHGRTHLAQPNLVVHRRADEAYEVAGWSTTQGGTQYLVRTLLREHLVEAFLALSQRAIIVVEVL